MTLTFFVLFILLIVLFIVYTLSLKKIVSYSNRRNLKIFGQSYKSVSFLYADISFLNKLFNGQGIECCDDVELRHKLTSLRCLFMVQLGICGFIFVGVIINGTL